MTLVLAASPTARRDEGRFIAARGLSVQAPATPDPWSLYLGGKRWGDLARLVGFFPIFFFFFFFVVFLHTRVRCAPAITIQRSTKSTSRWRFARNLDYQMHKSFRKIYANDRSFVR